MSPAELADRLQARPAGEGRWMAVCPCHEDRHPSLSIWIGKDGRPLLKCHGGCDSAAVLAALELQWPDVLPDREHAEPWPAGGGGGGNGASPRGRIVAEYDYRDAAGVLRFQVVRLAPQTFPQRRPDGAGGWVWNMSGVETLPYRLPELLAAVAAGERVYIPEGEKDADGLAALGLCATCNPGGALKFRAEHAAHLADARVVVLPDNDGPGRQHAEQVAALCRQAGAASVRVLALPGLPEKGDVSDWLAAGGTREELERLAEGAAEWEPSAARAAAAPALPHAGEAPSGRAQTDLGNGERLIDRHGADLRFCYGERAWYVWDARRWRRDAGGELERRAAETARSIYQEAQDAGDPALRAGLAKWAIRSEAQDRRQAMVASAAHMAAIQREQFDADPWLLCCGNGTVDLRTGELRPHRREDLLARMSPVRYDPGARAERWERFLQTATGGDAVLADFLQRAAGYSLTGSTAEEVLFFVYGPGASGKSTFPDALRAVLGDHAATADFETFLRRRDAGGPRNDIARLAGARLVVSAEVDEGRQLAEGLLKSLTGGDQVAARFLFREAFEFTPRFKLWLVGNHAPRAPDDDTAMWRRVLLLPFEHAILEEERDPAVKASLRDTALAGAAVLAWAVRGCLAWQRDGLGVPDVVRLATEAYRADQDPIAEFLEDKCRLEPRAWTSTARLCEEYEAWAKAAGVKAITATAMGSRLAARGLSTDRRGKLRVRGWAGIELAGGFMAPEADGFTAGGASYCPQARGGRTGCDV